MMIIFDGCIFDYIKCNNCPGPYGPSGTNK